jgi:hypothetical protein
MPTRYSLSLISFGTPTSMAALFLCFAKPAAVWFLDARSQPCHEE